MSLYIIPSDKVFYFMGSPFYTDNLKYIFPSPIYLTQDILMLCHVHSVFQCYTKHLFLKAQTSCQTPSM